MGLGFHIDTTPEIILHKNGEVPQKITANKLMQIAENLDYSGFTGTISINALDNIQGKEPKTPHWSYGGFGHFREKLAKEFNINLRLMQGFKPFNMAEISNIFGNADGFDANFTPEEFDAWWAKHSISWDDLEYHPIHELLNHSDCDGDLTSSQCGMIAKHLRGAVQNWHDSDYDKQQALMLCDCMDYCAQNGLRLMFC